MSSHNCQFKSNGLLKCWGANDNGQLGLGDKNARGDQTNQMGPYLPYVKLGSELVDQVSIGSSHTCVHLASNQIKCWGNNKNGQLGLGVSQPSQGGTPSTTPDQLSAVNLGTTSTPNQANCGKEHTCILFANKQVKCFGKGANGQLGYNNNNDLGSKANDMGSNLAFVSLGDTVESFYVSALGNHNCVILTSQFMKCWGSNGNGQRGYGDTNDRGKTANSMGTSLEFLDLGTEDRVKVIGVGDEFTCALRIDDVLKCCGLNTSGQLGLGNTASFNTMSGSSTEVSYDSGKVIKQIDGADSHNCILFDDNVTVKCIGLNTNGQLGQGDTTNRGTSSPTRFQFFSVINLGTGSLSISFINTLASATCIYFIDKSIKCFGDGTSGKLGSGSSNSIGTSAIQMGTNLPFVQIFSTFAPTNTPTTSTPTKNPVTPRPSFSPSKNPTSTPSNAPTSSPTKKPSANPTTPPSLAPTTNPTEIPSKAPTEAPSERPSSLPTSKPTDSPTFSPTFAPTFSPTASPTFSPTFAPTTNPTEIPSKAPTEAPSKRPSSSPTKSPTDLPSFSPTFNPSLKPSFIPSTHPSILPSFSPSSMPTIAPVTPPTSITTSNPTSNPSYFPTSGPTSSVTHSPTALTTNTPTPPITYSPSTLTTNSPTASSTGIPTKTPTNPTSDLPINIPTNSPTTATQTAPATNSDSSVAIGLGVSIPLITVAAAAGFFFFRLRTKNPPIELVTGDAVATAP